MCILANSASQFACEIGTPTWFLTLSAADCSDCWPELFRCLSNEWNKPLDGNSHWKLLRENPFMVTKHFHRRWKAFFTHILNGKSKPLGEIVDYFVRVEFQKRGSPHLHVILWIADAPDLDTEQGQLDAAKFLDTFVKTTIPDDSDGDLKALVDSDAHYN